MEQALQSQLTGPTAAAGLKAGEQAGAGVSKGIIANTLGTGPKLLKNLGLLGVGAEAFHAAHAVEAANNLIIRSTGASGKVAEGLEKSFKKVAGSTPAAFGTVATALSEVFQRTGLTGKGLEDLSLKIVTFNRITKDSPVNVQELTKTLAGFGVPASKVSGELDHLFVISQKTGVPLADLVSTMGTAGPIARQFGFSLDFTAGFLAQLNKAGVDSNAIIPGLRKAFITFAKEGKAPAVGLRETLGAIENLIHAGNIAGAQKIAVQLFGARGVGLVDAAVQGKISLQSLTQAVDTSGAGILKTAKKTGTLEGKLLLLHRKADLALASFGTPVLQLFTSTLSAILPVVTGIADAFGHLPGPLKTVLVSFVGFAVALGPIKKIGGALDGAFSVFKRVIPIISAVRVAFASLFEFLLANPIFLIAAAVVALGLVIFKFRDQIFAAIKVVARFFVGVFDKIVEFAKHNKALVATLAVVFGPLIGPIVGVGVAITGVIVAVKHWTDILNVLKTVAGTVVSFIVTAFRGLLNVWLTVVGGIIHGAATAFGWLPLHIGDKLKAADAHFQAFKNRVLGTLEQTAEAAGGWGRKTGLNFADGLTSTQINAAVAAGKISAQLKKILKANSPADAGPLSLGGGPGGWGKRFGILYTQGIVAGFRAEESRLTAQLVRTQGLFETFAPRTTTPPTLPVRAVLAPLPAPQMPSMSERGRTRAASKPNTVNNYLTINNPKPERSSSDVIRALRLIQFRMSR